MSLLAGLKDRARALFGRTDNIGNHVDAVQRGVLDDLLFDNVRSNAAGFDRMAQGLHQDHSYTDDLLRDMYRALNSGKADTRLLAEMRPTHRRNVTIEKELYGTPAFQELLTITGGDEYDSLLALMSLKDPMLKALVATEEAQQKAEEAHRQREQARQQAEQARKEQQQAERAQETAEQQQAKAEQAQEAAQQAQQQAEAAQQAAQADPNNAEAQAAAQGAAQAAQAAQQAADAAQGQASAAGSLAQESAMSLEQILQAAEQALAQSDAANDRSALNAAAAMSQLHQAMSEAAAQATKERDEERALFEAFGYGPGELQKMDFEERAALAATLKGSRIAEAADLVGGFRIMEAAKRRRKTQHGHSQVHGIELGNDLTRLLPSELVAMTTPELEDDFWKRFAGHQLMQLKLRGAEKVGKGAMVVVVDESATMKQTDMTDGHSREAYSKAMCLALLDRARAQERDFVYVGFGSAQQQHVVRFPKGRGTLAEVMLMTEHFFNGGTHFETPLEMARKIIADDFTDHGLAKADVMFITDGQAPLSDDFVIRWNELREKAGFRSWGVAVSAESNTASIERICDTTRSIGEFTSKPTDAEDIFRTI